MDRILGYIANQPPQEKQGDKWLDDVRSLVVENQLVIDPSDQASDSCSDLQVIEERIAL